MAVMRGGLLTHKCYGSFEAVLRMVTRLHSDHNNYISLHNHSNVRSSLHMSPTTVVIVQLGSSVTSVVHWERAVSSPVQPTLPSPMVGTIPYIEPLVKSASVDSLSKRQHS